MRTNLRRLGGWALCAPLATLGLTACGTVFQTAGPATPSTTATTTTTTSAAPVTQAADDNGGDTKSEPSHSTQHSGSGSGGSGSGHSTPAATVVHLTVAQQPACPVTGTPDAPFSSPGQDAVISWTVSGADGAAIGVDNPGTYGAYGSNYPASGTQSFAFGCEGDSGSSSHTFTVWPKGHPEISKTITVSARNNP